MDWFLDTEYSHTWVCDSAEIILFIYSFIVLAWLVQMAPRVPKTSTPFRSQLGYKMMKEVLAVAQFFIFSNWTIF